MQAHIPEDLKTSIFIVLPKKPRAVECSDFRTISLMCHTLKLLLTIILRRTSNKINNEDSEEQAGFRKYSGTRDGIFNIKIIVEKYIEMQKDVFACFIDYSKAFDTVKHEQLISCLRKTDIDESDIALIGNLYWQQTTKIRLADALSEPLKLKEVSGKAVSYPWHSSTCTRIQYLGKFSNFFGVKIGGHNFNNLRYADDTVLLARVK